MDKLSVALPKNDFRCRNCGKDAYIRFFVSLDAWECEECYSKRKLREVPITATIIQ